jgi:hypothetical protein
MCLLLALTGNWGKKGTGLRSWGVPTGSGQVFGAVKNAPGQAAGILEMRRAVIDSLRVQDPTLTDEIAMLDLASPGARLALPHAMEGMRMAEGIGGMKIVPTFFMWYHHFGFREVWNTKEWGDTTMARPFDEYVREAMEKGWWRGYDVPDEHQPPRVLLEFTNTLRRARGGRKIYLDKLWPQLKMGR